MRFDVNKENDYLIVAALRGPDVERSYHLKRMTTGVLRFLIGLSPNHDIIISDIKDAVSFWDLLSQVQKEEVKTQWWMLHHFASHTTEAFNALGKRKNEIGKTARDYIHWFRHNMGEVPGPSRITLHTAQTLHRSRSKSSPA